MGREKVLRTYGHHRKRFVVTHDSTDIFDTNDESHGRIFSTSSSESGFGPSESVDSIDSFNFKSNLGRRKAKNKALQNLQTADENQDKKTTKRKRQPRGRQACMFSSDKDSCPSSSSESFTPVSKRVARKALHDVSNTSAGPPASAAKRRANRKRQAENKTADTAKESSSSHSAYNFSEFDDYSLVISDSPVVTGDTGTSGVGAGSVVHGTSTPCQSSRARAVGTVGMKQVDLSHISPFATVDTEGHDAPADDDQSVASLSPTSPSLSVLSKASSHSGLTEPSCVGSGDETRGSSDVENLQRLEDSFASMRVGCRRLRKKPAHTEASKQSTDSRQAPACSPLEDDQIVAECKVRVQKLRENLLKQNHILQSEVSVQERFDASCSLFDASDHSLNLQSVKSSWLRSRDKPCDTNEGLEGSDASDTCSESDTSDSDSSGTGVEGAENLSAIVEDEEVAEETVEEGSDDEEEEGDEAVEDGNDESTPAGDDPRNCVSVTETRRSESLKGGSPVRYMLTSTSYLEGCDSISEPQKPEQETNANFAENENKFCVSEKGMDISYADTSDRNESMEGNSPVRYMLTSASYLSECDSPSLSQHSQRDDSILDHSSKLVSTPAKASLTRSFAEVLTPSRWKTGEGVVEEPSPRDRVLEQCGQDAPLPFTSVIPPSVMKKCVKIGEGVYGEVFRTTRSGNSVALKIIPIEGDFEVNDEPQKTFTEILPEIVISNELSGLRNGTENSTYNFCPVRSVSCVQGCYPPELLKQWDVFHEKKTSENDRPDIFGLEQLYILFEFGDGGCDLESCKLKSAAEGVSVLQQVACALAVAEEEMKFEHRDLHVGNVLVQPTDETTVTVTLNGTPVFIDTHGVQVNIIDFTLSRLTKDGCTVFCDLASDDSLFEGKGDYQFDIYRMMKKENKNHWEAFHPHTNVMWLHYLCDKLINRKRYSANDRSHREAMKRLRQALQNLLQYQSAAHFVLEDALFDS